MEESMRGKAALVKELHQDLVRKYQLHGPRIEQFWRSFDRNQRANALKAGAADGVVLRDPNDRAMGVVYKILPEWNLRDMTEPGSDFLLDILKHRATKPITEQYRNGVNNGPGDAEFITHSIRVNNLRHTNSFHHCFTLFMDEEKYGQSFHVKDAARYEETMASLSKVVDCGLCVPQSTGEFILDRQFYTLQGLNLLVEDILDIGSTSQHANTHPKNPDEAIRSAFSKLSTLETPGKATLPDLLASASDQKTSLEDYLTLCCTEPYLFSHAVNIQFFSRPELVPDEKGRTLPLLTDKYINIAIFEMIHYMVTSVAIWDYLYRLIGILVDESEDKISRSIILQELSNICHLEYGRAQRLFKRHVQTSSGFKHFKRLSGGFDNGNARVVLKDSPDRLMRADPQLSYLLHLCAAGTNASKAAVWIKKIDGIHQSHPLERDKMDGREWESFSSLAIIANFMESISTFLPLPHPHLKKGQIFISRSNNLATELDPLKTQINLSQFAVPIDNLKEPGMTEGALGAFDNFFLEQTGTKIAFLYQDLVEDSVMELQNSYRQLKAHSLLNTKMRGSTMPLKAVSGTSNLELRRQQRRQKDKTRPADSSIYGITPTTANPVKPETLKAEPVFKVKRDTVDVFSVLFSRSEARGSVSWVAFQAAMADMKFSVIPKFGSVFTFLPPEDMGVQKSLTLHRPHQSQIEGHKLLIFSNRLKRVYGWREQSFQVV